MKPANTIIDHLPLAVLCFDFTDLKVKEINPYVQDNFSGIFAPNTSVLDYIHAEDTPKLIRTLYNLRNGKHINQNTALRVLEPTGTYIWTLWRLGNCEKHLTKNILITHEFDQNIQAYILELQTVMQDHTFVNLLKHPMAETVPLTNTPNVTERERQVLKLIIEGKRDKEICEILYISRYTAINHRRNLLRKFKARNKVELVRIVTESNIF